jgi:DNA polymerase III epsilon subunit family exonuclease
MRVADRVFAEGEFVAFDLETTGLMAGSCRIVEVGAVRFRGDGTELGRLERLINPQCAIPWRATQVHGITDRMVRGQPTIEQVLPEFLEFLGADDTVLLAHNAGFDLGFLNADLARLELMPPAHGILDTLTAARRRLQGLRNHRLETVANYLGVPGGQHRALADSLTVKAAFLHMVSLPPSLCTCGELKQLGKLRHFRTVLSEQPAACGEVGGTREAEPCGEESLLRAIQQRRRITIIYDGGTKGETRRPITPKAIVRNRGVPYLLAFCHLDDMDKTYRLDRIRQWESR